LIGRLATAYLTGGYATGPLSFDAQVPVHVYAGGTLVDGPLYMGDIHLQASAAMPLNRDKRFSIGAWVDGTLPTGPGSVGLGAGRTRVGGGIASSAVFSAFFLGWNVGFRSGTGSALGELQVSPALVWGAGASLIMTRRVAFAVEADGEVWWGNALSGETGQPGAVPGEWLASVRLRPLPSLAVKVGGGTAISQGLGAPTVRAALGLEWTAGQKRAEPIGPLATPGDADGDGFLDKVDECVDQPEDFNGLQDDDGCPDEAGLVAVTFEVVDVGGRQVAGAQLDLKTGPITGAWVAADGVVRRALPVGQYEVTVSAEGMVAREAVIDVPQQARHSVRLMLATPVDVGDVLLRIQDDEGLPVSGAEVRIVHLGLVGASEVDGIVEFQLPKGSYELTVVAPEHFPENAHVEVSARSRLDVAIVLHSKTPTQADRAPQLHMKVFFEEGSVDLSVDALKALDELVGILMTNQAVRRVRVGGHSDHMSEAKMAEELSDQRADVVLNYLIQAGISSDRLVTRGYGYTIPLQEGSSEAVNRTNRRVEFQILTYEK